MINDAQTQQVSANLKFYKKAGFKKKLHVFLIVLASVLAAAVIVFILLFHRPSSYKPLDLTDSKQVSVYLTHELLPDFYNGVQVGEPFEMIVTQDGINDIVARFKWPRDLGSVRLSAPMVFFAQDRIVLMGTLLLEETEVVVTITVEPRLDADGLLNLQVRDVKVGFVDITSLAGIFAERIYQRRLADKGGDTKDLWAKVMRSVQGGEPFEPVFKVGDKQVRVEEIAIERKKLILRLVPLTDGADFQG